jgi:hypothetical protein
MHVLDPVEVIVKSSVIVLVVSSVVAVEIVSAYE